MRTFEKAVAAMIVRSSDNQIVMGLKHPEPKCNGPYSNLWVLPGGVVDDETTLEAARRETLEETGLDVSIYEARLVDDTGYDEAEFSLRSGERILYQMRFTAYQVDIGKLAESVPLISCDELVEITWAPIINSGNYNLCPPSEVLFHKLGYLPLTATVN